MSNTISQNPRLVQFKAPGGESHVTIDANMVMKITPAGNNEPTSGTEITLSNCGQVKVAEPYDEVTKRLGLQVGAAA